MSNSSNNSNNKGYDYYGFLRKTKDKWSANEKALVAAEIESTGRSIDRGIFKKDPELLAALGQRLIDEARERMGDPLAPSDNPDDSNPDQVKSGLWSK